MVTQNRDETYTQALSKVEERNVSLVLKILQWLVYSTRPLSVEEMTELATLDLVDTNQSERIDILGLIPTSFVTVSEDPSDTASEHHQIRLSHSVKEYLTSSPIKIGPEKEYTIQETDSHATIAKDCLTYLLRFNLPYPSSPDKVKSSALLRYATNHWPQHAKQASPSDKVHSLIMDLFQSEIAYLNWTAFLDGYTPFNNHPLPEDKPTQTPHPLYYASSYGLIREVKELLDNGAPVNNADGPTTALGAASLSGHVEVIQLLIAHGADVNSSGGVLGPAIKLAQGNGHVDAVALLLENGAGEI